MSLLLIGFRGLCLLRGIRRFDSATYDVEMYMQKAGLDFVGRYDPKYVHVPLISGD